MRLILGAFFCLMFVGCGVSSHHPSAQIVTTTGMIADAVQAIAGDRLTVEALMQSGVDPHSYRATQGDIARLQQAELILYNGLHLEGKLQDIFEKLANKKPALAVSAGVAQPQLLFDDKGLVDPHIWFDVRLWMQVVDFIEATLSQQYPEYASEFAHNATVYRQALDALHAWVVSRVQEIAPERRVLITAHDAFGYLGRAYGFEVHGLQGLSTVAEIGLYDVRALSDLIVAREIKAVFVEHSVSPRFVESLQKGLAQRNYPLRLGGTLFSDAMGQSGTSAGHYIGMMQHNINTLVEALK
jgi:manganese/zinc/iron transport system substrate-binding protein